MTPASPRSGHRPRARGAWLALALSALALPGGTGCAASAVHREYERALVAHAEEDHDGASAVLRRAFAAAREPAEQIGVVRGIGALAKAHYEAGELRRARDDFRLALELGEATAPIQDLVDLRCNLGVVYGALCNYQRAEDVLRAAGEEAERAGSPVLVARAALATAALHYNLRRYERAMDEVRLARESALAAGDAFLLARATVLEGVTLRQQGELAEAEETLRQALAMRDRIPAGQENAARSLGENQRALGEVLVARGGPERLGEARLLLEQALSIADAEGIPLEAALARSHLAEVAWRSGDPARAILLFEEARGEFAARLFRDGVGRVGIHLGNLHAELGRWEEARREFATARDTYEQIQDREWSRQAWFGLGRASEALRDDAEARRCYERAVLVVDALRTDMDPAELRAFDRLTGEVYERLVRLLLRTGDEPQALRYASQMWSEEIGSALDVSASLDSPGEDAERAPLLARLEQAREKQAEAESVLQSAQKVSRPSASRLASLEADLIITRKETDQLVAELQEAYGQGVPALDLHPERLIEMIRAPDFPDDRAIVVFFVAPDATYVFVGANERIHPIEIPVTAEHLELLVHQYLLRMRIDGDVRRDLELPRRVPEPDLPDLATLESELAGLLLDRLREPLIGIETIGLLPMGPLASLPFQALPFEREDGRRGPWIESANLVYLSYLNVEHTRKGSSGFELRPDATLSLFVDPDGSLQNARSEGEGIREVFPGARVFAGANASRRVFLDQWSASDIVHVASHAHFEAGGAGGLAAYIQLAPAGDDGRLLPSDIQALPPSTRPKLVVLSACSTNRWDELLNPSGTHLETLATTFAAQQSELGHSIIATLWDVDDLSTSLLMEEFYRQLRVSRRPYEALRAAQRKMRTGLPDDPRWELRFAHPYHWAAFGYLGAWE